MQDEQDTPKTDDTTADPEQAAEPVDAGVTTPDREEQEVTETVTETTEVEEQPDGTTTTEESTETVTETAPATDGE